MTLVVVPSVSQQLAAIRHTIAKTIMPALDPSEAFAAEQAGLVLASLDWAMDVLESEYRYEVTEHADQQALLRSLLDLGAPDDAASAALSAAAAGPPADLTALREQTRALKHGVERVFISLGDDAERATRARALVSAAARRQTARELAWMRMTGFPGEQPAVASVLDEQAAGPAPADPGAG